MRLFKQIGVFIVFALFSVSAAAAPFTFSVETDSVSCFGYTDGSAWVTNIVGGNAPFTYKWYTSGWELIPGETNDTISGLGEGSYKAWVTDKDNYYVYVSFDIKEPSSIGILFITKDDITCSGDDDGSISIIAVDGTAPLTYSITGGPPYQPGNTFSGLSKGDYFVSVQDYNNCTRSWSSNPVTIDEPDVLDITVDDVSNVTCSYLTDGYINVSVDGGTLPYDYAWTGPGVYTNDIEDIASLDSGDYDLMVTDDNGCTDNVGPLKVTKPGEIMVVTDSTKDAKCNGEASGAVYIDVTGGVGGYTYTWTNGGITQDIENLLAGAYSVEVKDANLCIKNHGAVGVSEPSAISVTQEDLVVHVSCNGGSDGEISVNVSGGTAPYTYAWTGKATTQDISGLTAGFYSLLVTDASGCTEPYGPIEVTEPPVLTAVHDSTHDVSCNGLSDGDLYITPGGGTALYTYLWTGGATTQDLIDVPTGTYDVRVTDDKGCTADILNLFVNQPAVLDATTGVVTDVTCFGGSDGSITINVTGGTIPYSYAWTDGGSFSAATKDISGIPTGTYSVTVTDANGCTDAINNIDVDQPTDIVVTTGTVVDVLCNGGNNGSIDISVAGGTPGPGYTYSWTDGGTYSANTQDIVSLYAGNYSVEVTDGAGCKKNHGPITVSEPPALTITQDSMDNVTCNGDGDGAIYVSVTGGAGGNVFAWTDGGAYSAASEDITGLDPGSYSLVVTDANGCTANHGPVPVTEPAVLSVTPGTATDITCKGDGDGSITVNVAGGTTPYAFAWTSVGGFNATTQNITGLEKDDYSLVVTDANGCTDALGPITINEPDTIEASVDGTSGLALDCFGDTDGSIDITASGGTGTLTYAWSGPNGFSETNEDISALEAGDYKLIITDDNACVRTYDPMATVSEPAQLVITQDSKNNVTCNGDGDGAIYVTVTGGAGGNVFAWTDGGTFSATTEDITGLAPANYSLVVTDANSCTANHGPVAITQPAVLSVTLGTATDITCNGDGDGSITVNVTGGTTNYTFAWTDGGSYSSTLEDISGLEAANYSLLVTDANGCTDALGPITINEPDTIEASVDGTSGLALDCFGDTDGSIDITASGGTGTLTYDWSGPNGFLETTQNISALEAGDYNLTVTDANACVRAYSPLATITEPPPLTISLARTNITCFNDNNGTITVTAGGGSPPYEYSRNGISWQPSNVFTGLTPVGYTIRVRNQAGPPTCQASDTISITQPNELRIITEFADNTLQNCFGDNNGVITITAAGGTGMIQYSIDSGSVFVPNNIFINLLAGNYRTAITDANSCLVIGSSLKVNQPPKLKISTYAQVDITDCYYSPTGQVAIEATGGSSPIRYIMDAADTNFTGIYTGLTVGAHTIDMIDAKGCTRDTTISIGSPPAIGVTSIDVVDVITCYGDSTGSLTLHAKGGTGQLEFSLDGGVFQLDSVFSGLHGGDYNMQVRDSNNCLIYPSATINRPDSIGYDSIRLTDVTCTGSMDGAITVYGSGGTLPLEYRLNELPDSNATGVFTALAPGTYTVTIKDANACPTYTTSNLDIIDPPVLSVDSVLYTEITCNGAADGTIEIFSSGGNAPHKYSVDDGANFDTSSFITGLAPSTYYIAVLDANTCMVWGDTITLPDPPAINLDAQGSTDVPTCYGDSTGSISVSASGGTGSLEYSLDTVNWQATGDFVNLPAGTYTPLVRDSMACMKAFAPEIIDQPTPITANITTTVSMNGNMGSIIISDATGGSGTLVFSADGPAGPFVTDTVFLEWPGFYDMVVQDTASCTYEETVQVLAIPPLDVNVSFTRIDCYNNDNGTISLVPVNATGVVQYSIDDGVNYQATGDFTNLAGGTYLIQVLDEDMRLYWDTVDIINPPPFNVVSTIIPATCSRYTYDGSITLNVSGATPGAGYSYLWSNDSTTRNLAGLEEGTYTVTITDAYLCQHVESYDITAVTTLIADAGRDTALCYQEQYILSGSSTDGDHYFWFPETGLSNPNIASPVATVTDSITYIMTVTEDGGCYDKDTLTLTVHADRGIDAGLDTTVAPGQTINLFAAGGPYDTYQWMPVTGLDDPTSQTPTFTVSTPINYIVMGTTEYGCVESDSVYINIASGLFIYSGFTPNGDGRNDLWDIDFVEYYPNITVAVFDRWGKQIFYTKGYTSDKRWDGRFKGKDIPLGTYYYIIDLHDGSEILKGPVTIVR